MTVQKILPRALDLSRLLADQSYFLLGPRQTGKSTLIRETLPDALVIDLLNHSDFLTVTQNPEQIEQRIRPTTELIIIDEIQKFPQLLDEVHRLIEERRIRFLLTGSSARKLRQGGVNLLGGRAGMIRFHPLLMREIGDDFSLQRVLQYGSIPSVYLSETPRRVLKNFVGTYLIEEIAAEGHARNLPSFSRFLNIAGQCNATIVNFSNVASDAQVPRTTVHEYFHLLRDTLIADELLAWRYSDKRKAVASSKWYFFDIGIALAIQRLSSFSNVIQNGFAFETWIYHELRSWNDYRGRDERLHYWKSQSGYEVDFLIGDHTAIEVKDKPHVGGRDLRSLKKLQEEETFRNYVCVCREINPRVQDGIEIVPYKVFLENLWEDAYT